MNALRSVPLPVLLLLGALVALSGAGALLGLLLPADDGDTLAATHNNPAATSWPRTTASLTIPVTNSEPLTHASPSPARVITPAAEIATLPVPAPGATAVFPQFVDEAEVESILANLTLEQKVGQMLMVGLPGPDLDDVAWRRVVQQGVGGVISLDRNAESPEQTRALTEALQNAAMEQGPGLPLLIGWNHEGGTVARRSAGLTHFPSAMALGATGRPDLVYAIGRSMAIEMQSVGVNVNFAPVLDVNVEPANPVIGLRSFGNEPTLVADLGSHFINGQQGAGVIAVAKHFPGHGGVGVDSHVALPLLDTSLDSLRGVELPPFQTAIDNDVAAVMVAHLGIPAVDPSGAPSSLSPAVVTGILREQMGFDGVVMTDDMGMRAIRDHYSLADAAVLAVLAGNDLLLAVETARGPDVMLNALLDAVADGRISESRINDSVRRLIRLKLGYDLGRPPANSLLSTSSDHQELARLTGAAAVTPLRDIAGWLPLPLPTGRLLLVSPTPINPGTASGNGRSLLYENLAEMGIVVEELFYDPSDPASIVRIQSEALARSTTVDAVVVITWDAILRYAHHGETAQEQLVNRLLDTGQPVVVVFGRLPYDRQRLPGAPTQIAIYGDTDGQLEGLVLLLLGPTITDSHN